jgi:hypothetical protein
MRAGSAFEVTGFPPYQNDFIAPAWVDRLKAKGALTKLRLDFLCHLETTT